MTWWQKALTRARHGARFWENRHAAARQAAESGKLGNMRGLGLPEIAASRLVCAHLFLEPLVDAGWRIAGPGYECEKVILATDLPEERLCVRLPACLSISDISERASVVAHPVLAHGMVRHLMKVFADGTRLIHQTALRATRISAGSLCDVLFCANVGAVIVIQNDGIYPEYVE